jgi:hypothetical protein
MHENNLFNLLLVFRIAAFGTKIIKAMHMCPQDISRRCDFLPTLWAFQTEDEAPDVINDGFQIRNGAFKYGMVVSFLILQLTCWISRIYLIQ